MRWRTLASCCNSSATRQTQMQLKPDRVRRYGSAALILAWAPLVGDALCAAAGWLRLNWAACAIWMALGHRCPHLRRHGAR